MFGEYGPRFQMLFSENTDPTLSQYEDLGHRPEQHMLYSHLRIDSSAGEENADPSQYESVQYETITPTGIQYEDLVI